MTGKYTQILFQKLHMKIYSDFITIGFYSSLQIFAIVHWLTIKSFFYNTASFVSHFFVFFQKKFYLAFIFVIDFYLQISQRMKRYLMGMFPNNLAPTVHNDIPGNPPLCSLVSFSIVWVTPFISKQESLRDLTTFTMSLTSLFDIINVVIREP